MTQLAAPSTVTFPVIETFGPTIQGEGLLAGLPTYFVRFGGCDYRCLAGDTRVLLPNLREKAISEVEAGDAVLGYSRQANNGPNHLRPTTVLAVRELPPEQTVRVTLDDGTVITGAADHRLWREFLRNGQVWRSPRLDNYEEMGNLVPGSIVKGPGAAMVERPRTLSWKRGYVAGAMDGDGHLGPARIHLGVTSRSFFDTALEASEAVGAPLREYAESTTTHGTRLYRSQLPAAYRPVMERIVRDFDRDDPEFCRGYLAGLFDAEGTVPVGVPYIAQNDGPVVQRALLAAEGAGIEAEHVKLDERAHRVLLREHPVTLLPKLDIGCEEKRLAAGLRGLRHLRHTVISVEPGPIVPLYDIQTGTENFIANGIVSHNCSWCDSMFAVDPALVREHAERLTASDICARLKPAADGPAWVTLSGGNPALLKLDPLRRALHEMGLRVAVETQGSRWRGWLADVDCLTVSPKPPSSGMVSAKHDRQFEMFMDQAQHSRSGRLAGDCLKIVVFDEEDLDWARGVFARFPAWPSFLSAGTPPVGEWGSEVVKAVSPRQVREEIGERYAWLCDRAAGDPRLAHCRVLPQLHVIGFGHARGV